jgi:hypothetical protein
LGFTTRRREKKCAQNCGRKPEAKRPPSRPVRTWNDNVEMGLKEICYEGMGGINLAHNKNQCLALMSVAMDL